MTKLSEHDREKWALFIGKGGKRSYNKKCRGCVHHCKQSYQVQVIRCLMFQKKV